MSMDHERRRGAMVHAIPQDASRASSQLRPLTGHQARHTDWQPKILACGQKNALGALPTELVELIASYFNQKDIVSFRYASFEIAGKSTSAFKSAFFNKIHWNKRKISQLAEHPELAQYVESVKIYIQGLERGSMKAAHATHFASLKFLTKLQSLEISDHRRRNPRPPFSAALFDNLTALRFTRLDTLILSSCCNDESDGEATTKFLVAFIKSHKSSLNTIRLHDVNLSSTHAWKQVLDATKCLPDSRATIHISAPSGRADPLSDDQNANDFHTGGPGPNADKQKWHITMTPQSYDPSDSPIRILFGPIADTRKAPIAHHFLSVPGNLHAALATLSKSCRLLEAILWTEKYENDIYDHEQGYSGYGDIRSQFYNQVLEKWAAFSWDGEEAVGQQKSRLLFRDWGLWQKYRPGHPPLYIWSD